MFRFKSLTRKGMAYQYFPTATYNSRSYKETLHEYLYEYYCYDDGLIQHSDGHNVHKDNFVDCLASLGKHLLENPTCVEEMAKSTFGWVDKIYFRDIDFFLSLTYNPDKEKYFCHSEKKVSSSESKRHDRRWEKIPEWADGTIQSCLSFLQMKNISWRALHIFSAYLDIRERMYETMSGFHLILGSGINAKPEDYHDMEYAFKCVDYLIHAKREEHKAKRVWDSLENNWLKKKLQDNPE